MSELAKATEGVTAILLKTLDVVAVLVVLTVVVLVVVGVVVGVLVIVLVGVVVVIPDVLVADMLGAIVLVLANSELISLVVLMVVTDGDIIEMI
jgi:uncharacterized membrane protein